MSKLDLLPPIEDWTGANIGLQYPVYVNEYGGYSGQQIELSVPIEPTPELASSIPYVAYFTKSYLNLAERLGVPVNFDPARVQQVQNLSGFEEDIFALSFRKPIMEQPNFPAALSTCMLESLLSQQPSLTEADDRIAYELMKHSFAGKLRYRYDSLHYTALYAAFLRKTGRRHLGLSMEHSYEEITAEIVRNGWD
jgi:hypothetical protein